MPATTSPFGLELVEYAVGTSPTTEVVWYPLGADNTTAIFHGDPVSINSGVVTALAATPTPTRTSNTPWGVCVGVKYQSPTLGFVNAQFLPASALTGPLLTEVFIGVWTSPGSVFRVQADGSVATTAVGKNAPLGNFGAGSTTTGKSKVQLLSGSIAITATLAVKIVGFDPNVGNAAGDAFTNVYVTWNAGVHALSTATGA